MEYYSAAKMSELPRHATAWIKLQVWEEKGVKEV